MKQKEGFVLRCVCGENVIVGEGLGTIDFGKLISLNETAAWLWKKAGEMGDFTIDSLTTALCEEYEVTTDFNGKIGEADAISMTRLQDEWGDVSGPPYKPEDYFFTGDDLKVLKREGIIMHPLPRRKEISTECDNDSRAVYWRQVRNGMWIRAALIATTFCRVDEITQYYMLNNR